MRGVAGSWVADVAERSLPGKVKKRLMWVSFGTLAVGCFTEPGVIPSLALLTKGYYTNGDLLTL